MVSSEEMDKTRRFVDAYAGKKGFCLNQDVCDTVIEGLTANREKYGFRYCPCRIVTGDAEKDNAIICPCDFHLDEIERDGCCHCMLFCG